MKKEKIRLKDREEVGMSEFFTELGLTSFDDNLYEEDIQPFSTARSFLSIGKILGLSGILGIIFTLPLLVTISFMANAAEPMVQWYKSLPSELEDAAIAERSIMYDANGDKFAEIWSEDRIILESLDDISQYAIDGLIATEDRRFEEHGGFDPIGTARAAIQGYGGGSGITQQLVKNLQFYDREATDEERFEAVDANIARKIQELRYAISYEEEHSKDEILLAYFNTVSFGAPNIYSIEAASQYLFDKSAKDLELHEAAALVGSVQNTSKHNLLNEDTYDDIKHRQEVVLQRMLATEKITEEEAEEAREAELTIADNRPSGGCHRSDYPFYCEYVLDELRQEPSLGADDEERNALIAQGGMRIETNLDPELMDAVNEEVKEALGTDNRVTMPVTLVEPGTGALKAFGFNRDYGDGEGATEINLAESPTGTGSSFKIITLAAAVNEGFRGSDLTFSSQCPWQNPNYETPAGGIKNSISCEKQGGTLDYQTATAYSSNTWYAELQAKIGIPKVAEFAKNVGLNGEVGERDASYTLGPQANSPINMAAAYATFAAEGVYCPPKAINNVEYRDGSAPVAPDNYDPAEHGCKRVMSPESASVVLTALQANMGETGIKDAFGADAALADYDAVGKSGTNQLYNQAWAMVSEHYALYANAYDFQRPTNGIDNYWSDGQIRPWYDNTAQRVGSRIMKQSLDAKDDGSKLQFASKDNSLTPVPVDSRNFVTIPSVVGLLPENALSAFAGTELTVHIDKDTCNPSEEMADRFPSGVIASQSVEAGEKLPYGSETEIILCTSNGEHVEED